MAVITGLDIGTCTIKAVNIKEKSGKYSLINFGVAEISEDPIESMDPSQKNVLIQTAIKRAILESGSKSKEVSISLSGDQVIVRYIKLPFMSKEELKGVIKYEAEQYIPFNIDQVVIDFNILGESIEEGQKKIEVLLVAIKEEVVNQYIDLLKGAGFSINSIQFDAFAIQNSIEVNYGKKEDETYVSLNIGGKMTNLNIVEDGITRFSRDIPIGGILLTKDISKEFNVGYAEAEKLKIEQGQIIIESEEVKLSRIPSKEDKKIKIYSCVVTTLGKLVTEIRRAFDFYESQTKKRGIGKIYLSGGSSKFVNMDKFLQERLKIPVEAVNSFTAIPAENIAELEPKITAFGPYMPVSVGLSLWRAR